METCSRCGARATYIVDWFGKDDEPLCDEHTPRWIRRKAKLDIQTGVRKVS